MNLVRSFWNKTHLWFLRVEVYNTFKALLLCPLGKIYFNFFNEANEYLCSLCDMLLTVPCTNWSVEDFVNLEKKVKLWNSRNIW